MTIENLIALLRNKLAAIAGQRAHAFSTGDVERVVMLDAEAEQTQTTLYQLETI
jgi:hypothetical protein